jgi:hypothetical protein
MRPVLDYSVTPENDELRQLLISEHTANAHNSIDYTELRIDQKPVGVHFFKFDPPDRG